MGKMGRRYPITPTQNGKGRESPKPFSFRMLFFSFREGMPPHYCFTASQGRAAEWTWAFFACFASVAGEKSVMGGFFSWELMTRWWQLTYFWNFHPYLPREMIHFEEHIFQMGWFNHQLDEKSVNFHWWLPWGWFRWWFFTTSIPWDAKHYFSPPFFQASISLEAFFLSIEESQIQAPRKPRTKLGTQGFF